MHHPIWFMMLLLFAVEIVGLIVIGNQIGAFLVFMYIVLVSIVGFSILRRQGIRSYQRVWQQMQKGEPPGETILDGIAFLLGGILFIIPGILTDLVGLFLVVPFTRKWLRVWLIAWLYRKFSGIRFTGYHRRY